MSKAPTAFRTISEVSDELDVPKHVLRFWEMKFPQIKPMKRGGGRRYYRPEDLALLKGICHLLHAEAYTIKGVQKILRERGVESVKEMGIAPPSGKRKAAAQQPAAKASGSVTGAASKAARKTATKRPATRGKKPAAPAAQEAEFDADVVAALNRAIDELQACRKALLKTPQAARKPRTRARAAAQARG